MIYDELRVIKHRLHIARVLAVRKKQSLGVKFYDLIADARPYSWDGTRYGNAFFASPKGVQEDVETPPRVLRAVWAGDNPMSSSRAARLDDLKRVNSDIPFILVTMKNVGDYDTAATPIHPAYEFLSYVHRSDYLRCFLSHHYGGAYSDIKTPGKAVLPSFDAFDDENVWLVTYPEPLTVLTPRLPGAIGRDLKVYRRLAPGQAVLISRPRTPLTREWLTEVHRRLDAAVESLRKQPGGATGRGTRGTPGSNPAYPLAWNELLPTVYHPLGLKYHEHVKYEKDLFPSLHDYR